MTWQLTLEFMLGFADHELLADSLADRVAGAAVNGSCFPKGSEGEPKKKSWGSQLAEIPGAKMADGTSVTGITFRGGP